MKILCIESEFWRYIGPAFLIAMGCVDPGNISGDIATGQMTHYRLLWLLVASSVLFYFYQCLAIGLSVSTSKDIASLCHIHYPFKWCVFLYVMAEIAILAADTQEVLGTAIALKLLFGMDYTIGVILSLIIAYLILKVETNYGMKTLHFIFFGFILIMIVCFFINFITLKHDYVEILLGFVPFMRIADLPYGISMLGSIIMPQSLFLHSSLVIETKKSHDMLINKRRQREIHQF